MLLRCIRGAVAAAEPRDRRAGHISAVPVDVARRSLEKNKSGYLMRSVVVLPKRPRLGIQA